MAMLSCGMLCSGLRNTFTTSRSSMQAIIVSALGDSSSLLLTHDSPVPQTAPGHALIKLQFSGVNYIDTYFRSGLYPTQLPYTPGDSARNHSRLFITAAHA
jgi:hypothetical protein